jgi:hypothetical protein
LAPSVFCLFTKLFLAGQLFFFKSGEEAIAAVEGYFADLTKNLFIVRPRTFQTSIGMYP